MLVLSRKIGEKLVIDGNITITVSRIAGNRVALGIEAPQDVRIVRAELVPVVNAFADTRQTPAAPVPAGFAEIDVGGVSIPRLAK